ncbi:MAG: NAD-dependent epimerase/dehydratase family protein [Chloroflexota bacterium]
MERTCAFITGATGFIGSHLARRLLTTEGYAVRALVRNPGEAAWLAELGAELVPGDITQPDSYTQAVQGCQIVFHTAGWVSERGTRQQVWDVNVTGTQHVVNAALAANAQRFVHTSSCSVYGSRQAFDIDERTPTRLTGKLYGDSKIAAEEIVFRAYYQNKLPVVVARISQVYGPDSKQFTIRPVEVIQSGKMVLIDKGRHLCKAIYIDNLVDALLLCARVDAAVGEAINLTENPPVPWSEFFGAYARMMGIQSLPSLPYPIAWLAGLLFEIQAKMKGKRASFSRGAVQSLRSSNSFSNQKARDLLGWEPAISLEEGMRRTEAWLRQQGYITSSGKENHNE